MLVQLAFAFTAATLGAASSLAALDNSHRFFRRVDGSTLATTATALATKPAKATEKTITAIATSASGEAQATASASALPLTHYTYAWDDIPYQVNPYKSERGPQSGYNICNSTTEGDDSLCQTLVANDIKDFCLWGSDSTGSTLTTIGDIEAATVSYCTQKGHGGRLIRAGALKGVQVLKTEAYIQWTGLIDQTALHLVANDTGGELDPHGADLLGNPVGGLVYSTGLPSGNNSTLQQVVEWNNFLGQSVFCLKLCDPLYLNRTGTSLCENRKDRMGCSYNMPASYREGEFSVCDSELQDVVGVYTGVDGKVSTYSQPPEGTVVDPPYTPRVPKSSNCKTYASTDLFGTVTSSTSASATGHMSAGGATASTPSSSSGSGSALGIGSGSTVLAASSAFFALIAGAVAVGA